MAPRTACLAITVVAALSLAGCATPAPDFVPPASSPTATIAVEPEDDYLPIVPITDESQCPVGWVPAPMTPEHAEAFPDQAVTTEIAPGDFDPSAVGDVLDSGCVTVAASVDDGSTETRQYQAYVVGDADLVEELDSALRDDGFTTTGGGVYLRKTTTVVIFGNDEGFRSEQLVAAGFADAEYVIISAYRTIAED